MRRQTLLFSAGALIGSAALYRRFLREPILTWGATRDEAGGRLPGDELLEQADGIATRAITIDAPRAAVWPWIAQIGPSPRGGAYRQNNSRTSSADGSRVITTTEASASSL